MAGALAAEKAACCPAQDGLGGDAQEERSLARAIPVPRWRLRSRQSEPAPNAHDAVQELVLVSLPHARPELPPGEGGDLVKEPVVLVDEALVGGMAKAPRTRHLKGLCRDQEITPLADERLRASTALAPGALNV